MSDSRLGKLYLSDRGGDDEDADVVGERIGRNHEEAVAVGSVAQRPSGDDLVVDQGDFDSTSMLGLLHSGAFDVPRVSREVPHEENTLQACERNDDAFVAFCGERRPEGKLRTRRAEIL